MAKVAAVIGANQLTRDSLGIPILDADGIEELAERFLRHCAPASLARPEFTPLPSIVEKLIDEGQVTFDGRASLGRDSANRPILGRYDPVNRHLMVARDLSSTDPRFPFVLGHELGHFYLHTVRGSHPSNVTTRVLSDTGADLRGAALISKGPHLREWQANRFAAAILLPRATIGKALLKTQKQLRIASRVGHVWLDDQPENQQSYRAIVVGLGMMYQCSQAVVKIRLDERGLVTKGWMGRAPVSLRDVVQGALAELFPIRLDRASE